MIKITSFKQLKPKDVIFNINSPMEKLEFFCIHPYNKHYALFLNEIHDGTPKFHDSRLINGEWYLYEDYKSYMEVLLDYHESKVKYYKKALNEWKLIEQKF